MSAMTEIDCSECPLVEAKAEVHSGSPVLRGTRMPVDAIVDNFDYGASVGEIAEQFELQPEVIPAVLSFAQSHRVADSGRLAYSFGTNVPVGVRRFLSSHEIRPFYDLGWHPQLANGKLLAMAEEAAFDVMVTSDQNIQYQQNLTGRKLALVGSNIWRIVRERGAAVAAKVEAATPGSYQFIEMPLAPKLTVR